MKNNFGSCRAFTHKILINYDLMKIALSLHFKYRKKNET